MAEYLINLAGNCCELFIILFFLKDNYKLRVKKQFAIPLCGLFLLFVPYMNKYITFSVICQSFYVNFMPFYENIFLNALQENGKRDIICN